MIGALLGHYRILEKIGEGGMGVVYRAHDEHLDCDVVVKVLPAGMLADEAARKRFKKEALALARLNHPNIAIVHDFDTQEGNDFLVMEYIAGETLSEKLFPPARNGAEAPLVEAEILHLGMQLAEGLAAAHESGIIHRDLKPGNLRITPDGRLKILDFGLALLTKPFSDSSRTLSDSGLEGVAGTLPYLAPEQLNGQAGDARSDIYSAGIVLLQMATAKPPGLWDAALLERLSPELQRIIQKCLERDPALRYSSARDLQLDLKQLSAGVAFGHSLAVLYFENLSGAEEDVYFRDGITEDIITELCKVKPLRVFPRSAVLAYRDKSVNIQDVSRKLEAAHVLCGSLRRVGKRLRINAQLVEGRSGHSVWAERYDRELKDVFDVQAEIARCISQALRIRLSPQEEEAIASKPTLDPQAYDHYLRGRSLSRRATHADLDVAVQMYERAIALDPDFALAFAGLAIACGLIYEWHGRDRRWIDRAIAASERALALQPNLAEALAAQARIAWAQEDYAKAAELAERAIVLKPNCEHAYWTLGQSYFNLDRLAELDALSERAIEFSGADYNVYVPIYLCLERLGQKDRARRVRERQTQALERHLEEVPEDVRARILLSGNHASFGNEEAAIRNVMTAVAMRPNDSNVLYNSACMYGILGKKKEALDMLRKAHAAGFSQLDWAVRDTDLTCLHDDPEFLALVEHARQKLEVSTQ